MTKIICSVYILLILLVLNVASCGNLVGDAFEDDDRIDTSDIVSPTVSPESGSIIFRTGDIVITFNESMDIDSLSLSGDISLEVKIAWSPGLFYDNSILTISPSSYWSYGVNTLIIDCKDLSGNEMEQLTLTYTNDNIWIGTQQLGTSTHDIADGVTLDSAGNIYVTGYTGGAFDGNTNAGERDIFLVRYNLSGEKIWTRQMGSNKNEYAYGVATDNSGNIYITGRTYGELDGNTHAGDNDIYLVKYDSSGEKQWTRQMGTAESDYANGLAIDSSGNIYVTGFTWGSLDGNINAGKQDIYLVKFNPDGEKQWTQQMGTTETNVANGIAIDSSDNIYVAGSSYGDFYGNTNEGGADILLVKYNSGGVKQWTQLFGSTDSDYVRGVSTDGSGNIYVIGLTYGDLEGNTNAGRADIFLVRFDSSGEKKWAQQIGTDNYEEASGIATDSSGNIYLAGYTQGDLDGNTNAGGHDFFLAKYNSTGDRQWIQQMGTDATDDAGGVITDSSGNIYVAGHTGGALDGNTNAGNYRSYDIFLAKYDSEGDLQ